MRVIGSVRVAVIGGCLLGLAAFGLALDARAEAGPPRPLGDAGDAMADASQSCVTSGDCFVPTPYCHPDLRACVECLGPRNCESGVCDLATHTCSECLSDADCSPSAPYCDSSSRSCVECLTDRNCAPIGVECVDHRCGSCGDGVCSSKETLSGGYFGPLPGSGGGRVLCQEDCGALCPTEDLGSALGERLVERDVAGLRDLFISDCSGEPSGPDLSLRWVAPHTGTFLFDLSASSQSRLLFSTYEGGCSGFPNGCTSGDPEYLEVPFDAAEGQELFFVVDTTDPPSGSYVVGIREAPAMQPTGDGGPVDDTVTALCLDNAASRGEAVCDEGTRCACEHCPRDYDDCGVIPGCDEIRACMEQNECIGAECYNAGFCRAVIDTYQGVSGPAFRAASGLQSCSLTFDCQLPCPGVDAGTTERPDAGRLCEPGREVACTCDGGSGTQRCLSSGNAYSECRCEPDAGPDVIEADEGSCGCRVGKPSPDRSWLVGTLVLAAVVAARRKNDSGATSS